MHVQADHYAPIERAAPRSLTLKLAPDLSKALRELAASEDLDVKLLVTLLIRAGLERRSRS